MDVPDKGLVCDLLWSDPDEDITGWGDNDRGVSWTFGGDVVREFLDKHGFSLIARAHQVSFFLFLHSVVTKKPPIQVIIQIS